MSKPRPAVAEPTPQQRAGRVSARHRQVDAIARRIERLVSEVPPLTEAQRTRLLNLLDTAPTRRAA